MAGPKASMQALRPVCLFSTQAWQVPHRCQALHLPKMVPQKQVCSNPVAGLGLPFIPSPTTSHCLISSCSHRAQHLQTQHMLEEEKSPQENGSLTSGHTRLKCRLQTSGAKQTLTMYKPQPFAMYLSAPSPVTEKTPLFLHGMPRGLVAFCH